MGIFKRSAMILATSCFISFNNIASVNAVSSSFSLSSYSNSMTLAETLTEVEQEVEEVADNVLNEVFKDNSNQQSKQSPGWELARQKRTAAIKAMERNKMIKV